MVVIGTPVPFLLPLPEYAHEVGLGLLLALTYGPGPIGIEEGEGINLGVDVCAPNRPALPVPIVPGTATATVSQMPKALLQPVPHEYTLAPLVGSVGQHQIRADFTREQGR